MTLLATLNGVSTTPSPYSLGNTDSNGDFPLTGTETSGYVGSWVEQIFVGGVQVGADLEFEVIPPPASLSANTSFVVDLPTSCGFCTYGIAIDVGYNILTSSGTNLVTTIPMVPTESGTFYVNGRVADGTYDRDIGGYSLQYSDASLTASTTGIFHDVPIASCWDERSATRGLRSKSKS